MNTPDKTPELQQADDMMVVLMNQRNAALNDNVQLQAQLRGAMRRIEELEARAPKALPPPTAPAVAAPVAPKAAPTRKRGRPRRKPAADAAPSNGAAQAVA